MMISRPFLLFIGEQLKAFILLLIILLFVRLKQETEVQLG